MYSGFCMSAANGRRSAAAGRDRERTPGSSLNVSSATPRGSLTSSYSTPAMSARASAVDERRASAQPPNARNCMNSRSSDRCGWPFFMPPFSLMSGGSGPRRVRWVSLGCDIALSIISRDRSHMPDYRVRPATLDDADVLVRHRIGMFTDMGVADGRRRRSTRAFRAWLREMMPAGTYRALAGRRRRPARSSPAAASRSCPGRPVRGMSATGWRSSTTSTPSRRIARRGPGAADHGGHPRLVPRGGHHVGRR